MSTQGQPADNWGQSDLIDWMTLWWCGETERKRERDKRKERWEEKRKKRPVDVLRWACAYLVSFCGAEWGGGGGSGRGWGGRGGWGWRGRDSSWADVHQLLQLQIRMLTVCSWREKEGEQEDNEYKECVHTSKIRRNINKYKRAKQLQRNCRTDICIEQRRTHTQTHTMILYES